MFFDEIHRIDSSGYLLINCGFFFWASYRLNGKEIFNHLILKESLAIVIQGIF
ncbi:hypothetical protein SHD_1693 [Shewanella decolorationis S12]|uniref:Uncharacterized protein n=1 Tax=Shewanella decolorationis S12 TaxID=1353536 RepID=A0ABP2Z7F9_9GAMM|nr:hypothetical protein SHD_1693 [Shewanella decolorationis S12]